MTSFRRTAMRPIVAALFLPFCLTAYRGAASDLEEFQDCVFIDTEWADGDSFHVRFPDGSEKVIRLYFVDCIEKSVGPTSDKRRLREQSRYFGVADLPTMIDYGEKAYQATRSLLSRPFTVRTSFANAMGRSAAQRYYAFIETAEGRDLATILVERGLARARGLGRETPDGIRRDDWQEELADLELRAALSRNGIWKHSNPDDLIAMRKEEREEMRGLETIDDAPALRPPSDPVDLNSASLDDLVRAGLRESLAAAAIQMRPFKSVDDLINVKGIGPVTLEKVRPFLKVEGTENP